MNDLTLRPIKDHEVESCLVLCRESMMHASHYSLEQRQAWAAFDDRDWCARLTQQHSWGAFEAGDELLGVASWRTGDSGEAWLDLLYVSPVCQRLGVGGALLGWVEDEALRLGFKNIATQASLHLQPLLRQRGYITIEARRPVVHGQALPCAWMQKVLP